MKVYLKGTERKRVSGSTEQDEAGPDVLTVKGVDGSFGVVNRGHECKAEASDFSVLPLDDDILRFDNEIAVLVELDNLVDRHLPWQTSHLDSLASVGVVELVSQADILKLGPSQKMVG